AIAIERIDNQLLHVFLGQERKADFLHGCSYRSDRVQRAHQRLGGRVATRAASVVHASALGGGSVNLLPFQSAHGQLSAKQHLERTAGGAGSATSVHWEPLLVLCTNK